MCKSTQVSSEVEVVDKMVLDKIISLAKRRGFVFQSSEIYGGFAATWDYGPLGVELKNNVKKLWWNSVVRSRLDVVGMDSAILMHPDVWVASGHVEGFNDPMIDCLTCRARFREDFMEKPGQCPSCGGKDITEPRQFNLMFKTQAGSMEGATQDVYLRPETAQGIFVQFKNVMTSARMKLPFGIAQIGKSFRNEVTTKSFIFRSREFEQMELEYFVKPGEDDEWFAYWIKEREDWYIRYGVKPEHLHRREHDKNELSHYSKGTIDLEFDFPFGRKELEGIANRTDFDLKAHIEKSGKDLVYFDEETREKVVPYCIESSAGVDRALLTFLCDAYEEDVIENEERVVLRFHPAVAPIKIAVFPLMRKDPQINLAMQIFDQLKLQYNCQYDQTGSIGKRYRRQDEIGTPYCITVDFDSLEDGAVTIRNRDETDQVRIKVGELKSWFNGKFD
ncbi:glycine--tRNA ligase [bacterium]|nr:glycine--tRNA ligase [bacterium]MBU1024771.1 glycine--tRNA ligase [bacterium]